MLNLDIITSGLRLGHPVSLLDFSLIQALIASVSGHYDCIIIFDAPPLVDLGDTKILSIVVAGLLFVIRLCS